MTDETESSDQRRTVPVEPPVHVEVFASHCSLTWTAAGPARFLEAVRGIDAISASTVVVVDTTVAPRRERVRLQGLDAEGDATR